MHKLYYIYIHIYINNFGGRQFCIPAPLCTGKDPKPSWVVIFCLPSGPSPAFSGDLQGWAYRIPDPLAGSELSLRETQGFTVTSC